MSASAFVVALASGRAAAYHPRRAFFNDTIPAPRRSAPTRSAPTRRFAMMTLYYAPGACSMAAHIVMEESGEKYQPQQVDLAGGEQRTEAYLKINPLGRVPAMPLETGEARDAHSAMHQYDGTR